MPDWFVKFPSDINFSIKEVIDKFVDYLVSDWEAFFDGIKNGLGSLLNGIGFVIDRIPYKNIFF